MEEMIIARQCVCQRAGVLIVARKTDMSTATRGDDVRAPGPLLLSEVRDVIGCMEACTRHCN